MASKPRSTPRPKPSVALKPKIDQAMADVVNAFLRWPLPDTVASDTCCTRPGPGRIGTNLLTCPETVSLVQDVVRPIVERLLNESCSR